MMVYGYNIWLISQKFSKYTSQFPVRYQYGELPLEPIAGGNMHGSAVMEAFGEKIDSETTNTPRDGSHEPFCGPLILEKMMLKHFKR